MVVLKGCRLVFPQSCRLTLQNLGGINFLWDLYSSFRLYCSWLITCSEVIGEWMVRHNNCVRLVSSGNSIKSYMSSWKFHLWIALSSVESVSNITTKVLWSWQHQTCSPFQFFSYVSLYAIVSVSETARFVWVSGEEFVKDKRKYIACRLKLLCSQFTCWGGGNQRSVHQKNIES